MVRSKLLACRSDLNSAYSLGEWVSQELASSRVDALHIVRVIIHEIDRWFKNELSVEDIKILAREPARTGDPKWDALIEGVIAYRFHIVGLDAPCWCQVTRLDEGWDPYDTPHANLGWRLLDMFETPVELLEKGVTLSYRSMELL